MDGIHCKTMKLLMEINNCNDQIYAHSRASNIPGFPSDPYIRLQNPVFDYALPLHQIDPFLLRQDVIGNTSQWDAVSSTTSAADSIASVNAKPMDRGGESITDLSFKEPVSSHPTISPSPAITSNQEAGSSSRTHNLVKLETTPSEFFSRLIQQTPQGFHCGLLGCTFPHKTFSSAEAVIEHIRTEDVPQRKPLAVWCSCNKWFSSKSIGLRHVISENEGMQYKCPIAKCTRQFKRKDQMVSHLRAGHPKTPKRRKARGVV
ncbi:hypothetical protein Clacol_005669 [Clathrus columnatus]|uniref:C2H2-type domain-containing protein n=1 Tax=Clathrus columnatus TaxID=1419009 RepID=A0AAV5AG29_9AGAM|nr:hypothetical protein Clacol_005669 [Clathrus columnatus]